MPPKVSIPTPTAEEIKQHRLKVLECKRTQVEDRARRKAEKGTRPKKKAKATKDGSLELWITVAQEGPSEPSSERPAKFSPSSSRPPA